MYWTGPSEERTTAAGATEIVGPRRSAPRWLAGVAATAALLGGLALAPGAATARTPQDKPLPTVSLADLPAEARATYQLIHAGGPFPYQKDGTVFQNRERHLPSKTRGYYREYTVKTPRSRDRGARRIVCGGQPPTAPEACFYTADHYASFSRIGSSH